MWLRGALLALLAGGLVLGCSTNKKLVATGGSRSDGTVTLSYEHTSFENPKLNIEQGIATAKERCQAWGYPDAEPFGGETRQCQQFYGSNCVRWFVSMTFQ